MRQEGIDGLAVISTENNKARNLDFSSNINDFAERGTSEDVILLVNLHFLLL